MTESSQNAEISLVLGKTCHMTTIVCWLAGLVNCLLVKSDYDEKKIR